jgi:serine/threonine protein kinase
MATVFLAHDLKHERDVAVKLLHPELALSLGGERFEREIKLAAKLQHLLGLSLGPHEDADIADLVGADRAGGAQ